jgi:hypothetical protein
MKNIKNRTVAAVLVLSAFLIAGLVLAPQMFAQGGNGGGAGGSGFGGSGGDLTQDRDQDRDRIQDPATYTGDEPIQDRDQDMLRDQDWDRDRDRIQDLMIRIGDEPVQDQDQLRDRLRDQIEDPDQDRDRDRIRVSDSEGLQEVISIGREASDDVANGLDAEIRELSRNRNRVEVGVIALMVSQNMVGPYGQQISGIAQEIHGSHRTMIENEEQIQSRSMLSRFFFGGDRESAQTIQAHLRQNEERMEQIKQYLNDCECGEQVRNILQEQLRNMEEEHARLEDLADGEASRWGLFSWRF